MKHAKKSVINSRDINYEFCSCWDKLMFRIYLCFAKSTYDAIKTRIISICGVIAQLRNESFARDYIKFSRISRKKYNDCHVELIAARPDHFVVNRRKEGRNDSPCAIVPPPRRLRVNERSAGRWWMQTRLPVWMNCRTYTDADAQFVGYITVAQGSNLLLSFHPSARRREKGRRGPRKKD